MAHTETLGTVHTHTHTHTGSWDYLTSNFLFVKNNMRIKIENC